MNGRFELFAFLDNPTGVVCHNGLPGLEANGVCCEAQCGECGGLGCSSRPGGRVRWCRIGFVSCLFRLLPCSLLSLANSEACSFACPGPRKRGKIAGTQSLTDRLASYGPENVHYSAPQRRQVRRAVCRATTGCYGRRMLCMRRSGRSHVDAFF